MAADLEQAFREFADILATTSPATSAAAEHRESIKRCLEAGFGMTRLFQAGSVQGAGSGGRKSKRTHFARSGQVTYTSRKTNPEQRGNILTICWPRSRRSDFRRGPMNASAQRDLVRLLCKLRTETRQQSGLEARLVPPDIDTAYRIAAMVAEELGWSVGGWKIAAMKEEMQKAMRTDGPIYGRVFRQFQKLSPAVLAFSRLTSPIPEVEYQAKLGADLPPRDESYTIEEVTAAVETLHLGIEIGECRFVHDEAFPPLTAILADGAGSGHIVYGPPIKDWRNRDIADQEAVLRSNGAVRRQGTAAAALDHPMVPLTWLANELSRTGIGLKAGELISTGSLTGMIAGRPGATYEADFGSLGAVAVKIE